MNSRDDIICNCMQITRGEIIDAIRNQGVNSFERIGDLLEAGTVCGSCEEDIEEILRDVAEGKV